MKHPVLLLAGLVAGTLLLSAGPPQQTDRGRLARITLQQADRMIRDTQSALFLNDGACSFTSGLATRATILDLRAGFALGVATCVNEESGTPIKYLNCLEELFEEFTEGLEEAADQHEARLELCDLIGPGIYDPDLDEDDFVEGVDHPYLPLLTGAVWIYQKQTDEGLEEITVEVLDETMCIDDIECIVVRDTVTLDGEFVEDTLDWFAQDEDGTVWYMGEIALNYEDGQIVDIDGSWRAGEDGGQPGVIMMATPIVGTTYRQELLLTEAEDAGTVLSTTATVTIGIGTFANCLETRDFTPLEPEVEEFKYYAPGVGVILELEPESGERLELISFTPGT